MRGSGTAATPGAHRQQIRTNNDVIGHGRVGRTGSIGLRLLLPVVASSIGLVAGGVTLVATYVTVAGDAQHARVLADGTTAVVRLVDEIEQEVAETNALRERGGKAGMQLLTAQRARTDRAMAAYLDASRAAQAAAPQIARPVGHVTALLDPFAKTRAGALEPGVEVSGFGDAFENITQHLLDLANAIAEQVKDQKLGNLARSAAAVSEVKHLAAAQRSVLRTAFVHRELTRAELIRLAELNGDQRAKLSEFSHIATDETRRRFNEVFKGPDVDAAAAIHDAVLDTGDQASLAVDADAWYIAQSGAMRLLRTVERELTEQLDRTAQRSQAAAERQALLAGAVAALVMAGTLAGGTTLAVRTTRRLRRLRQAALTVARGELPLAVAQVASAPDPDAVRGAMGASHHRVAAMLDAGRDEVAEVSAAIGVVHQQALRLAAEQALLRLDVSALFVALSRRGQSLVHRQLQLIDEFERSEQDPDVLSRLFVLDHLAARMRRNEENLLVLAGGEPGRRFETPVVLTDVVRAAAAEIEDYARVDAPVAEAVWVAAHAVGDIIQLLAELLDNATTFSPPHSRVRVLVRPDVDGVALSVVDSGIGMSDAQIAEGNHRLSRPTGLTSTLVGTMGLLVVARLAARRDVRVVLMRNATGGTTAEVRLPGSMLVSAPPRILSRPHSGPVTLHALAAALPTAPARSVQEPVPVGAAPAAVAATPLTAAGLPLRTPGTHGVTGAVATHGSADLFPDPETVRARLASLASGIAAAQRRIETPPGASYME